MPQSPQTQRERAPDASRSPWPVAIQLLFRFAFTYFLLSGLYWIFQYADKSTAFVAKPYQQCWRPFVLWTAAHLFQWRGSIEPNFVHDTRYLYALLTCFLLCSLVVTLLWSWLDRRRGHYPLLNDILRTCLRYELANLMLHYGMDKIFLLQFPAPGLSRLVERFGDYSPNSLMWAFVGSSTAYTIFGGLAEIAGAVLLLSRKTTTGGALITFAVMFNVTVMDFSYDVSVKLLCLNILLMALYLIVPETRRLLKFFFFNQPTEATRLSEGNYSNTQRRLAGWLKVAVVLYLIVPLTVRDWRSYREVKSESTRTGLHGLYETTSFALGGRVLAPLVTDTVRWRYVIFDAPGELTLGLMDGSLRRYRITHNVEREEITFDAEGDPLDKTTLKVIQQGEKHLTLEGSLAGKDLISTFEKIDPSSFTLLNRGFHWVNEATFSR